MFDLLIKNGTIIDGTGAPGFKADIGICSDTIAAIGELQGTAKRIIEAEGLIVAPGFIDIHSHTDEAVLVNPSCESKVMQGVTTEVSGNCGSSSAPRIGGRASDDDDGELLAECGIDRDWQSMDDLLTRLERVPLTINFATLVGHGAIRSSAMGYDDRKPSRGELDEMRRLTAESMEQGAFGISTGLIYPPGCYADTDELVALAEVAAKYGGIYASHIRSEGDRLIESVEEAIEIGRRAGIRVQLSHHKATGRNNWGKVKQTLQMIDDAVSAGIDVSADQYPYAATATNLGVLLPNWAHDGGKQALLARLTNPEIRSTLKSDLMTAGSNGWIAESGGWEVTVVNAVNTEPNRRFEGFNLARIAEIQGKHPADVVLDLLAEEHGSVGVMRFVISEDDIEVVMKHPRVVIGTDAMARSVNGPLSRGKPHPRSFGTFPRVLGRYVREKKSLSMESAIAKMTGNTAKILSIADRGLLRDNWFADIIVFDADTIMDTATYSESKSYPVGIKYVLVNGRIVVDQGTLCDHECSGYGRVLRKKVS